ncbi:MAG: glycosyltransferase, partial [Candidatus Electrothrix sp. AR3]|nr:glycosyltransferase [Candidatus Electrothrix sp. AR3]
VLSDYQQDKTRVLFTSNQGLAAARNNGIREAKGEYILPLDADDRIGPSYLERAVEFLDQDPVLGIVYCRAQLFGEVETEWLLPPFSLEQMLQDNIIFCSALFRYQDWQQVGGYCQELRYGWEDYDFWLSLLEMGRTVYQIPEILFYYRVAADSMVRARPRQHKVESFAQIFRRHQGFYTRHIEVWVDKLLAVGEQYHQAQLLPVNGNSAEYPHWTRKVDTSSRCLKFQLVPKEQGGQLEFRPAHGYVILRLDAVLLRDEQGAKKQVILTHNAEVEQDGILCFCSLSPSISLTLPELSIDMEQTELMIELEYLAFGQECIPQLMHLFTKKEQVPLDVTRIKSPQVGFMNRLQGSIALLKRQLKLWSCAFCNPHYRILKQSGLFDAVFYLEHNRDVDPRSVDPLVHYLESGWQEQRNPNPLVEAAWYRQMYALGPEQEPLLHYLQQGWQQGNKPNLLFFTAYYGEQYPESSAGGQNPLGHYLQQGWQEGKNPNPLFDSAWYLAQNPEVAASGQNPLAHYYHTGSREQRNPMPFFSMRYYCERNASLEQEWLFPLLHFWEHGNEERQIPSPCFDPLFYRQVTGLEELGAVELFLHYAQEGWRTYRPSALFAEDFYRRTYPHALDDGLQPLEHYQEQGVSSGYYPCPEVRELAQKPLLSILTPVYNTNAELLRRCIHSVLYQAYPHWQLCLVDDGSSAEHIQPLLQEYAARDERIKIRLLPENQGISLATNQAAELAIGEYVAFLDHDDELHQDALYHIALAISRFAPDALYSDEELIDWKGFRCSGFHKSDYNPELLLCHNYITHFFTTRRSLFQQVGGLSASCTGAQDYDLVLKICEQTERVHHIRRSLYR